MGIKNIYDKLPICMQNCACNLKGYYINKTRYNKEFFSTLDEFLQRGKSTVEERIYYRNKKIQQLVEHCYRTVPYYTKTMDRIGMIPSDVNTLDDLSLLPIIDKQIVIQNYNDFLSTDISNCKVVHAHTSGTTGAGFKFLTTMDSIHAQWANFWRHYYDCGIEFGTKQATFSGQQIVPISQTKPPFWRSIKSENRLYFSAYHESDKNLFSYYESIIDNNIIWINGYPSLLVALSDYMNSHGLKFEHVKYVTTGAENLYDYQILSIEKAFGVRPVQTYGQSENVAFFSQNLKGEIIVDEDAAATELIPIHDDDNQCLVVGTNLYNYAMPLLRYKTGDTVSYKVTDNPIRIINSIDGRTEDYIYCPDGTKLGKVDTAFKDAEHIREAQIYQHLDYSVTVFAVARSPEGKAEAEIALGWLRNACANKVSFKLEFVEAIPRTKTSKLRYVISEVPH